MSLIERINELYLPNQGVLAVCVFASSRREYRGLGEHEKMIDAAYDLFLSAPPESTYGKNYVKIDLLAATMIAKREKEQVVVIALAPKAPFMKSVHRKISRLAAGPTRVSKNPKVLLEPTKVEMTQENDLTTNHLVF